MDELRNDAVYASIKGHKLPSEKVCRDLVKAMSGSSLKELKLINKRLPEMQANGKKRDVVTNFDDTVCTILGKQESASVGYNPRYHVRLSFKEKLGIIANTNELVDITLEDGKHHTNNGFSDFVKSCESQLPDCLKIKRIRVDRGAFDHNNSHTLRSKDMNT